MENETTGGEFNIHEAAKEIIAQESEPTTASTDESSSAGQSEQESNQNAEGQQLSPEEILKQVSEQKEAPAQFAELLKSVNGFGMTRNGQPVSVESADQLKDLIQKGFDYTYKTQEHTELAKAKEAEFQQKDARYKELDAQYAQKEQEHAQVFQNNNLLVSLLGKIQSQDPELFQHLDKLWIEEERQFSMNKPLEAKFQGEISKLNTEIQSLKGQTKEKELGSIKQGWEQELKDVQGKYAASLGKLGVKPDWKKVEEAWKADSSNTLSVEQAFYAVHGKDIQAANESYKKLLSTKNKTQAHLLGRSGMGASQGKKEPEIKAAVVGDYGSLLREAAAQL